MCVGVRVRGLGTAAHLEVPREFVKAPRSGVRTRLVHAEVPLAEPERDRPRQQGNELQEPLPPPAHMPVL